MHRFTSPLNDLKIASPCTQDWNGMLGDDRKRFCGECKLNVYNLSGMTRSEAESLILNAEGRVCVRFYKRADGSVITQDCPVGLAKLRQRTRAIVTAAFSMLAAFFGGIFAVSMFAKSSNAVVGELINIATPTPTPNMQVMGAIAYRPELRTAKGRTL